MAREKAAPLTQQTIKPRTERGANENNMLAHPKI
jgi:hypothetical protein